MKMSKVVVSIVVSMVAFFVLAAGARSAQAQEDEPGIAPPVLPTAQPAPLQVAPPPPPLPAPPAAPPPPARLQVTPPPPPPPLVLKTTSHLDAGEPGLKSPGKALGLSLGITLGSLAASVAMFAGADSDGGLVVAGIVVGGLGLAFGPSAGHFYAGDIKRGLGMGFGRLGVLVGGLVLELSAAALVWNDGDDGDSDVGAALICFFAGIAAGTTALALAIWDIVAAPGAARRANKRLQQRLAGLTLGPLVTDPGAGKRGYGLALGGRF